MKQGMVLTCAAALLLAACSRGEQHQPVGDIGPSVIEQERYLRRLHVDLNGAAPSDDALAAGLAQLAQDGSTATTRRAIAADLMSTPAFADVYISELENRALEGDTVDQRYDFACFVFRTLACDTCEDNPESPCDDCDCAPLPALRAEREDLAATRADFAAGASSSSIERRYAITQGFRFPLGQDAIGDLLFMTFLDRPIEGDEQRNATAMIFGSFLPNSPAGTLFHRHGADYDDLIDIVFRSEPYRDAAVHRVFGRYLGRDATPTELRHFSSTLAPDDVDIRTVIEAVVSSAEYFNQ